MSETIKKPTGGLIDEIDRKLDINKPSSIISDVNKFESFLSGSLLSFFGVNLFVIGSIAYQSFDPKPFWSAILLLLIATQVFRIHRSDDVEVSWFQVGGLLAAFTTLILTLPIPVSIPLSLCVTALLIWLVMHSYTDQKAVYPYAMYLSIIASIMLRPSIGILLAALTFTAMLVVFTIRHLNIATLATLCGGVLFGALFLGQTDIWEMQVAMLFVFMTVAAIFYEWRVPATKGASVRRFVNQGIPVALSLMASVTIWDPETLVLWGWALTVSIYELVRINLEPKTSATGTRIAWVAIVLAYCALTQLPGIDSTTRLMLGLLIAGGTAAVASAISSSFLSTTSLIIAITTAYPVFTSSFEQISVDGVIVTILVTAFLILFERTRPRVNSEQWWSGFFRPDHVTWVRRLFAGAIQAAMRIPIIGLFIGWSITAVRWMKYIKGDGNPITLSDLAFVIGNLLSATVTINQLLLWLLPIPHPASLRVLVIAPVCAVWGTLLVYAGYRRFSRLWRFMGSAFLIFPLIYIFVLGYPPDALILSVVTAVFPPVAAKHLMLTQGSP